MNTFIKVLETTPGSKAPKMMKSKDTRLETGTFDHTEMDWSQPVATKSKEEKSEKQDSFDWGAPVSSSTTADTGMTISITLDNWF